MIKCILVNDAETAPLPRERGKCRKENKISPLRKEHQHAAERLKSNKAELTHHLCTEEKMDRLLPKDITSQLPYSEVNYIK